MPGLQKYIFPASLLVLLLSQPVVAQTVKVHKSAGEAHSRQERVLPRGDAILGKTKSDDERCQECHGHDGHASDIQDGIGNIGKFPKLAGQHSEYIVKQLRDFRSHKRSHDIMNLMASSLSEADQADIAAYFSSQKRMQGDGKGNNQVGRNLFLNGDASRNILPCVSCHSVGEEGAAPQNPVIGGQHRRYLAKQLIDWKAGVRRNSPGDVMTATAKALTDAEIEALSDFIAGL